jgi:hypothetical protein
VELGYRKNVFLIVISYFPHKSPSFPYKIYKTWQNHIKTVMFLTDHAYVCIGGMGIYMYRGMLYIYYIYTALTRGGTCDSSTQSHLYPILRGSRKVLSSK